MLVLKVRTKSVIQIAKHESASKQFHTHHPYLIRNDSNIRNWQYVLGWTTVESWSKSWYWLQLFLSI